ncbi:MAG TPA: succinylglutamate desuccinylase/aspartoacylase family protein [Gammaproteobacteria bacterium]|nr:succinylglutamate desuccinylase/aspartoacylase family protein [Gammaproteobacteria bacterium]
MAAKSQDSIEIAGVTIKPGHRESIDIPLPSFYTHSSVNMPVHVVRGRKPGPTLLVSGTIHGDEITGVEIIRRLLTHKFINRIRGTLIAIPVVNVYGFVSKSRYLPDRRDLNRSFPGSESGSMAARLAHVVMTEILPHCTHIVDLHSGAVNRENLPQIRAKLKQEPELEALAHAFGVPVILDMNLVEGSLREAAYEHGIPVLVYEAGEALRFNEVAIRAGVQGVLNVMAALDMRLKKRKPRKTVAMIANASRWVRAPQSGILRSVVAIGARVAVGDTLAYINDPLGEYNTEITSEVEGIVIGRTNLPLVFAGEAVFNIAIYASVERVSDRIEAYHEELAPNGDVPNNEEPPLV